MILSKEELFPGGGGALIAELLGEREHDGRLVQIAQMVGYEKDRSLQALQIGAPTYLKRDKASEEGAVD